MNKVFARSICILLPSLFGEGAGERLLLPSLGRGWGWAFGEASGVGKKLYNFVVFLNLLRTLFEFSYKKIKIPL